LDPPLVVVAVLPPAGGVGAHRLDVAVRPRTDPHVLPGGRDGERLQPVDPVVLDQVPVAVVVGKAASRATPGPAGAVHVTPPQSHTGWDGHDRVGSNPPALPSSRRVRPVYAVTWPATAPRGGVSRCARGY